MVLRTFVFWATAAVEEIVTTSLFGGLCVGSLEEAAEQDEDLAANPDSGLLSVLRLSALPLS